MSASLSDFDPETAGKNLAEIVCKYDPKADKEKIIAAYELALQAHADQRRENGDLYISHPVAVAKILAGYKLDTDTIVTALLHDVIEDTSVGFAAIQQRFGTEVAALVDGVTKLTRIEPQSGRSKQAENFRKLVLAMSKDIRVLLVKLADRLHNMRTLHFVKNPERRQRIARETIEIYAPLAERIDADSIKTELQTRAFMELEPEAYGSIMARLNFLRGPGEKLVEAIKDDLAKVCKAAKIDVVEINGREKSAYSIWMKMKRRNVTFEQLSDIMAFRIVVKTHEACYAALGAVHSAYPMVAGRFKDYISTPKANGYQSLHTGVTLKNLQNQKIEIQIRTREMHDFAENGIAAHWFYKQPEATASDTKALRWVQDLLDILENSGAADEFLENTKLELYQDQVFCFTPKGRLITMPRGATPVDFAYAIHSQIGDSCVGARVGGRLVPLRHILQNGDQVEILTARGGTPSPQWERFVVTGKARARIRRFVHQQQREQYIEQGRTILLRTFRQFGAEGDTAGFEAAAKQFKYSSVDDVYVAVASGHLAAKDVVQAVFPELIEKPKVPNMVPFMVRPSTSVRPALYPEKGRSPVIGVIPGIDIHYAGCCRPVPGDPIVGIVAGGRGITIHVRHCQTLENFSATPERFLEVDWAEPLSDEDGKDTEKAIPGKQALFTARISIFSDASPHILPDLANAVLSQKGMIPAFRVVNSTADFMEISIDVDVRDLNHLSKILASVRGIRGINQADRAGL